MRTKEQQNVEHSPVEVQYPRYISNHPKGVDMFEGKSQESLAQAVASHITETDEETWKGVKPVFSRLIGLEGKWGSGKSNVIKILEEELNKKGSYTFFTFDVWGNQEDLQRRSILELLTRHLMRPEVNKLTGKTKMRAMSPERNGSIIEKECTWPEKLESLLSRKSYTRDITVPSVNASTKWFVLALLFVGIVVAYLAVNKTDIWWLDIIIALSPLILFALGMFVTCSSWREMFAMYNTGDRSDTTSYVISEQEPSVREFKEWMAEISNGIPKTEKLVLVFDNMDRLSSDKVHQFWSLIQTFFADDGYQNIWCIIPYDEEHLASAFSEASVETERLKLLRCFLDKTFPVVFRVPEPIVSDYKTLFADLLNQSYGNTMDEDDKELVSRCYRHLHPTPNVREMISFINKTVTLTKQWQKEIHPVSIAVYTLKEHDLLRNPRVDRTNNGKTDKVKVTTEEYILDGGFFEGLLQVLRDQGVRKYLRKEIASLVYGIQPDAAIQIVIRRYIKNCFTGKVKEGNLNTYAANPHFIAMLDEEIHDIETIAESKVVGLIAQIDESKLSAEDKKGLAKIWRYFGKQYVDQPDKPTAFSDYEQIVFSHQTKALAEKCATAFCKRLLDNKDVDGGKLFVQLENLFNSSFAAQFNAVIICPTTTLGATRYLDYVEKAADNYRKYPLSADAKEVNSALKTALGEGFAYYQVLRQLKDNKDYTVQEVADYAVAELNKKTATAPVAYHLINVQRLFFDKLQSQLDAPYTATLWQSAQSDPDKPLYDEIYALRASTVMGQMPDTDRHIALLYDKSLFYTSTTKLLKEVISNRTINCRRKVVAKMVTECKHDSTPDYPEFVENWENLKGILGVTQESIIQFADAWGVKDLSEAEADKPFFTLLSNAWIDALLSDQTPLAQALLTKCASELTIQPQAQFAPAGTANHTANNWDVALGKLIDSPYINSGNMGNLNLLAVQLLDVVAQNGAVLGDTWRSLLQKVDYANVSAQVVELRNKILNGQGGYAMTPAKFKVLHTWLRHSDIQTRSDDAANQILAKVVDDSECQAIILAEKDYYAPIISNTVVAASGLHTKLKKMVSEQGESDFAQYVAGLVKYVKESEKG